MKYVRTSDGTIFGNEYSNRKVGEYIGLFEIVAEANTIQELCDRFIIKYDKQNEQRIIKSFKRVENEFLKDKMYKLNHIKAVYGATWADEEGLIYRATMNDNGGLELL